MGKPPGRFDLADLTQQVLGAVLIAGGLLIPGDIWEVAAGMSLVHAAAGVALGLSLTYIALSTTVERRDSHERPIAGFPLRFASTVAVALAVSLLFVLIYDLPLDGENSLVETAKAVLLATFFSALVAAVADSAIE
ncbi:hypothetical protein [Halobaculum rarum]|uniref:hypothetical protein n=1 Tax=Halobaculum rarum TaxID=3075122 RepID=UPI0032AF1156